MELKAMYEEFDESSDPYEKSVTEIRPIAIKPAWKQSKIFEPHSVTYVSPQPTDKFNFIALVILLQGISMFLPSNLFINAEMFFRDFKINDIYLNNNSKPMDKNHEFLLIINKNHLILYYGVISSTSSLIAILFNVLLPISPVWSLTRRITLSIVLQALVISSIVILSIANTSDHQIIYVFITIVSIILLNVSNGVFQTCIHAMTAFLPSNYGRILMFGIYFGGLLLSAIQITSIYLIENQRFAYIYYFVASILLLLFCFDFYYTSSLSRFYRYFKSKTKSYLYKEYEDFLVESSDDWSLSSILSKTWKHYLNIYLVCLVSYSIYPSIQVNIQPKSDLLKFIPNKLLIPITTHLIFNLFSTFGCCLTSIGKINQQFSPMLLVFNLIRVLFIPFYVFCNLSPDSRQLPVLVNNEFVYLSSNTILGLSNGYLLTYSVMKAPKCVKPEQSFTAGMLSALFIILGLMSGSVISFIIFTFII